VKLLTPEQVNDAIVAFSTGPDGKVTTYRVLAAQDVATTYNDGIGGHHFLALGLRETGLRNIEGGAKWDEYRKAWVAETDPMKMDVGWCQISRRWHLAALAAMPGVKAGTWKPVVEGKWADDAGYVPRFTDALRFCDRVLRTNRIRALEQDVPRADALQVAINGYNRGIDGAIRAYHEARRSHGNIDAGTAGNDYGSSVLAHAKLVKAWIDEHENWKL
jgi:hypothetical protein